jgi:hypothetical protein
MKECPLEEGKPPFILSMRSYDSEVDNPGLNLVSEDARKETEKYPEMADDSVIIEVTSDDDEFA